MELRSSMLRMLGHTIATFLRALWHVIRVSVQVSIQLAGIALSSIWVGIPVATQRMSGEWLNMAIEAKVPEGLLRYVQILAMGGTVIMILLGWIIVALLTVIALAVIF